jgi:cytochrome P450
VVGKQRFPSLEDKDNMPYVSAVLLESLRSASLAFIGVPHAAYEDVQLGGFTIPKGATVMPSLFHALYDPEHFKDPDLFNPDRFINAEGKFVNDERMIAFGVGKRVCLGQTLAEKEFFIFFTGILQQFELIQVPGTVLPSYVDIYPKAILRSPPQYEVILKKRF